MVKKNLKRKNEENKIAKEICEGLEAEFKNGKLAIGTQKHVMIGCTVGVKKNELKLLFQSAKQDVVVFLKEEKERKIPEADLIERFRGSFCDKDHEFTIPFLIFEVKYKNITTHQARQYSEEARMIKHIFPFCLYNLVLIKTGNIKQDNVDKVYMAGKNFDEILYFDTRNSEEIVKKLKDVVKGHMNSLKENKYFRFKNFINGT